MKGITRSIYTFQLLIILGGIGFPILVNFKDIILYHIRRFLANFCIHGSGNGRRFYHLYNLNTRIVADCYLPALGGGHGRYRFF